MRWAEKSIPSRSNPRAFDVRGRDVRCSQACRATVVGKLCALSAMEAHMSKVLVVFGTTEGQTARIARSIGDTLKATGLGVDVVLAGPAAPSPDDYDAVVVAASVHGGSYQKAVRQWARGHASALNDREAAFVSVSLGILEKKPKVQGKLAAIANRFLTAAGWRPATVKMVAGALPYTRYNPLKRWLMKRIVAKAGGDTDTSRDYEYTDWADVRAFAVEFAQRVRARPHSLVSPVQARPVGRISPIDANATVSG